MLGRPNLIDSLRIILPVHKQTLRVVNKTEIESDLLM